MKRFIAIILSVIMVLSLSACAGSSESAESTDQDTLSETEDISDEISDTSEEVSDVDEEDGFEELMFYESDGISVSITDIEFQEDGLIYYTFRLNNETEDEYNFKIYSICTNGIECNGGLNEDVMGDFDYETQETGFLQYSLLDSVRNDLITDVSQITQVDILLRIKNEDTGETVLEETLLSAYPDGEENAEFFEPEDDAEILLDNEYVTVTWYASRFVEGYYGEYVAQENAAAGYIFVQNKTDEEIAVGIKDEDGYIDRVTITSGYGSFMSIWKALAEDDTSIPDGETYTVDVVVGSDLDFTTEYGTDSITFAY